MSLLLSLGSSVLGVLNTAGSWVLGTTLTASGHEIVRQVIQLGVKYASASGLLDIEGWTIDQYFEDLTQKARNGDLRPAVGREKDLDRLFTALSKQTKGNVCITGDAGVGKTALIEGLAYAVAKEEVPDSFKNVRVLKINMVDVMVGRSYTSDNNCMARMRAVFDAVKKYDEKHGTKTILVMDEFHQVVKYQIAELCKQNFDRDEFQCVAATTTAEYNEYIRKDAALERRFPELRIEETNIEQTLAVLGERIESLEKENDIKISEQAIKACVYLPGRYMLNRHFPDKSIDVLNSSVKNAKMSGKEEVTDIEVREEVEKITGIPVTDISSEEVVKLMTMEQRLNSKIIGQEQAIKTLCNSVRSGRLDMNDPSRPLGSFIFAGNSGVGKTLLAEELGKEVGHIIRLDMSQYTSKTSFYDLLLKDGELPREIVKHPHSVILLDNIEKAGIETKNVVAEILDKGVLGMYGTDQKLNFRNSYIIMTTTVDSDGDSKEAQLSDSLGSNLINRADNLLWFNKLTATNAEELARDYIFNLRNKIERCGYSLDFDDSVFKYLFEKGVSIAEGARGLRKLIENGLANKIISIIMEGTIGENQILLCSADENGFKFEVKELNK